MLVRISLVLLLAVLVLSSARSEETGCYWNAPGLPYSMKPPAGLGRKLSGNPLEVTFGMYMNAPDLAFKWACGAIDDEDVANARSIYQGLGCTPDSSLGRMIEGLASGGIFVSELMTVLPMIFADHRDELAEFCAFIDSVPPECFRYQLIDGEENNDRIREMNARLTREHPQCVDKWPRFKEFGDSLKGFLSGYPGLDDITARDRALLESARVE